MDRQAVLTHTDFNQLPSSLMLNHESTPKNQQRQMKMDRKKKGGCRENRDNVESTIFLKCKNNNKKDNI